MTGVVFLVVFLIIIILFVLICFYFYNKVINLRNRADEAESGIDVQLKKRFDLIPNLVSTVQEYMKYEKDTLNQLTELRTQALKGNISHDELMDLSQKAESMLKSIMVSVENYPELKASANMELLQRSLNETEDQIAASRRAYNIAVRELNNGVDMIPTNIFASMLNIKRREFIEIKEQEKENLNVSELFKR